MKEGGLAVELRGIVHGGNGRYHYWKGINGGGYHGGFGA